jgi:catechol 2,3-dioxygenase-like lactoylglutathione lyase family enzyme
VEANVMDYKFELMVLPVSDVDRARDFYVERAGFELEVDTGVDGVGRVVQLTPPGSACSIAIGTGLSDMAPGSVKGLHLMVRDIVAARAELAGRGVPVGEIRHLESGAWRPGPQPERQDYNSFAEFTDPDGNLWLLQERRAEPGR